MSPTQIEHAICAESDLVGIVVCIGDHRSYITGLIMLDPAVVAARGMTVEDAAADAQIAAAV